MNREEAITVFEGIKVNLIKSIFGCETIGLNIGEFDSQIAQN